MQVGLWVSHEASHFSSGSLGIWSHQLPGTGWKKEAETYMIKTHQWDQAIQKAARSAQRPRVAQWLSPECVSTKYTVLRSPVNTELDVWVDIRNRSWHDLRERLRAIVPQGMRRTLAQQDPLSEVQSKGLVFLFVCFFKKVQNEVLLACQCRRRRFDPWARKIPWRREWQPTPISLSGKSHGQRNLARYSPRSCKQLDTTECWYWKEKKKSLYTIKLR